MGLQDLPGAGAAKGPEELPGGLALRAPGSLPLDQPAPG